MFEGIEASGPVLVDINTPVADATNYRARLLRGTSRSLHPANAGDTLMGDVWYAGLEGVLPRPAQSALSSDYNAGLKGPLP